MLCTNGLLLHLVGKRQLLVYPGASYGNGKLGDSIWESHHKSSAQGVHRANTPPLNQYPYLSGTVLIMPTLRVFGVGAIVAPFVPTECSGVGGMRGIFRKPLKRAIWNTRVCMLY